MKVVALVSGGKDSCYTMMKCIEYGHEIVALANLLPIDDSVDELDSYMYQTVGHQIIVSYAECMNVPLFRRRIRGSSRHQKLSYQMTQDDEVEDMFVLLSEVKRQIPSITAVSSGAIASDYQRLRVESICSRLGLVSLAFLWKQDQTLLLQEMIANGIKAILVKVAAIGLDPAKHLGKDLAFMEPYLLKLKELYGSNVCGEGGEYETLTLDCPLFTNARIVLDEFQVVLHSPDCIAPVGVLHPSTFHLEKKENPESNSLEGESGLVFEVQGDGPYISESTRQQDDGNVDLVEHTRKQPYCRFSRYILENSQVASARFQAAAAIKEAAIREWSFLATDDKGGLISFCLGYVMQHANSSDGYVFSKVSSVAAQLMKRGWLEFTPAEKEVFFYQINQAILGSRGLDVQFIGINFLESLVSEFSPSTSSAMGLPREFHENCHKSLEQNFLKTFYSWAQDAALSVTNKIIESHSDVPEVKVCNAALRVMHQILNWEFRYSKGGTRASINVFSDGIRPDTGSSRKTECVIVQPGASWCDVLLSSSHVGWLINLYSSLRQKFALEGYWLDCPVAVSARKLIVQLCSLAGEIFPSNNAQMQEQHLLLLLSGVLPWIDPPDVISKEIEEGRSGSEMIDGCRALLSIGTVTTPVVFDRLLRSIRPFGTLTLLSMLMGEVVKVLMANSTDKETWSYEARDILLDTWTTLLASMDGSGGNAWLPPEGMHAAASLFSLIAESELKVAAASATADEDDADCLASVSAMDERLGSYALIARAAVDSTIPFLAKLFSDRVARLHQGRGTVDPTETLEEVYSLLLIIGHVLADEGEGETALVPDALQSHFVDVVEAGNHPVVILSSSIIKFTEQCMDADMRSSIFSPRLMEAVVWFLARWSFTYLMLVEDSNLGSNQLQSLPSRACLFTFFNERNQGKFVLDIIVRISLTSLMSYPGEKDLQELTCFQLLHALVRRRNICFHLLSLDSWRNLANAFANDKTLFLLNSVSQRSLAQTLVLSAYGMRSSDASNQYVKDLMAHMTSSLVDLSNNSDLKNLAQQPDIIMLVSCVLERLRGAASATEPRTQRAIYEMGLSVMNPVLCLLEVYKHESAVIYLLLKFVVDWVDGQLSYLEAHETAVVINFCMSLLQIYSSHNIGKISLSLSSTLLNEAKTEKYKDLRALLQLLSHLCSKDMVDFSSDSIETQSTNISQVVYFGLHIITPLITLELLKYPKLCFDYFSLISHMLEVYPETLAQLNSDAFNHVLTTVDFGLHQQDVDIVTMCLRALKALASYHYKETKSGNTGLGSHAAGHTDPNGVFCEGILSRFLRTLLHFLLFEDYSTDLVSTAADALFPLILCEPNLYQGLGNELIEKQGNPNFKTRLANALHVLTTSNQLSSSLDRLNYQRFRKNLNNFLVEVRGFLKTR